MNYIGVDPGASGSLAVINGEGEVVSLIPFDEKEYKSILYGISAMPCSAVVEHVGAMPKQGVSSTFKFGQNFGFILGLMTAFEIPFELVRPQKWKKEFSCTSDKNTSIAVAQRLFPKADLRRTPRCFKPHDGHAEALLMAEYCRRKCRNA